METHLQCHYSEIQILFEGLVNSTDFYLTDRVRDVHFFVSGLPVDNPLNDSTVTIWVPIRSTGNSGISQYSRLPESWL